MSNEVEVWKDIEGYEGFYQVSNFGKIKSFKNSKEGKKFCFPQEFISLSKNKAKKYYVSNLVAKHFIPNPENNPHVFNIDGNKSNNHVNNLVWSSRSKMAKNKIYNHGKIPNLGLKPVNQIDLKTGNVIKTFPSQNEASKTTNILQSAISNCCLSKTKSAGGYGWEFAERSKESQMEYEKDLQRTIKLRETVTIEKINELYEKLGTYKKVAEAFKVTPKYISYVRKRAKVDNETNYDRIRVDNT